ncbi:MAG: thiamine ABC transporter substrate-binding protein, partial [Micrococcales bacterium]|nr:thiamine ABC transporter substrate-binding protein [Micrococcales bacterium]
MVNQLILTKEAPLGDAVFGIDNTLASRALEEGILATRPSDSAGGAGGASDSAGGAEPEGLSAPSEPSPLTHALPPEQVALSAPFGDDADKLTAITTSDVCVLADHRWFAAHDLPEPTTFSDLAKPEYASLLVVENPATSSPGLSFLLATISALGDSWPEYWRTMTDGGVKVVDSWSSAYYVDFSGPSSEGDRPLVVSYASSPPAEVPEGGSESPVGALLDTCFRQVEYAGVLAGGASEAAAWVVVDFLASRAFQDTVAENMWVFPADPGAGIPPSWTEHAPRPSAPWELDPRQIATHRDDWIRQWTDIVAS